MTIKLGGLFLISVLFAASPSMATEETDVFKTELVPKRVYLEYKQKRDSLYQKGLIHYKHYLSLYTGKMDVFAPPDGLPEISAHYNRSINDICTVLIEYYKDNKSYGFIPSSTNKHLLSRERDFVFYHELAHCEQQKDASLALGLSAPSDNYIIKSFQETFCDVYGIILLFKIHKTDNYSIETASQILKERKKSSQKNPKKNYASIYNTHPGIKTIINLRGQIEGKSPGELKQMAKEIAIASTLSFIANE